MSLLFLFTVVMAIAFPVVRLEDLGGNPFVTIWTETALPLVQSVRWQLVVLLPASLGLYTILIRVEVMGSSLGWVLPGIRRGWLVGELVVLLPVAVGLGHLAAEGTSVARGAAAMGVALVAFNLPGLILHPAVSAWPRRLLAGLLVLGAVFPTQLSSVSAAMPVLVAALTLPAAVILFRIRHSDWAAREDTNVGAGDQWERGPLKRWGAQGEWAVSLASEHRTPWLRAVFYESGFGSTSRALQMRLMSVAFLVSMTYALMDHYMLIIWAGMLAGDRANGLSGGLLYPVSRDDRGRLVATAVLLDAAFALFLLIGGTWLLDILPIPLERSRYASETGFALGLIAATAIAFLPMALWGRVRDTAPLRGVTSFTGQMKSSLYVLLFVLIAATVSHPLQDAWHAGSYLLVGASLSLAALALYPLFWYTTLRHYRRSDLGGLTT